jgi:hypothetical protein
MTIAVDYELTVREAEKSLREARTADEVRNIWRKHYGALGHRTLGRLLVGRTSAQILAKQEGVLAKHDPGKE